MENHHFVGAILHYLCISNGKFKNKLAFVLQTAVPIPICKTNRHNLTSEHPCDLKQCSQCAGAYVRVVLTEIPGLRRMIVMITASRVSGGWFVALHMITHVRVSSALSSTHAPQNVLALPPVSVNATRSLRRNLPGKRKSTKDPSAN